MGHGVKIRRICRIWLDNFFDELYTVDSSVMADQIIHLVQQKVTHEMNEDLCNAFTEKEISDAMFQMGPLKEPGPDGFLARFYQKHWLVMKQDVVTAVQIFFVDGTLPECINDTAIVLIPKGVEPTELKDFRPISMCNAIYKLISKCLVNLL
jgi:hypothetical protein